MRKLHPNAFWLFFIQYVLRYIFLTFFLCFCFIPFIFKGVFEYFTGEGSRVLLLAFGGFGVFATIVLFLCYTFAKLTYDNYLYELREDGFYKESGVITKKYVTIPYERIQNVDINRGILARILGLSDLQIQTAGMSASFNKYGAYAVGAEGRLPGVSQQEAVAIRDDIVKRARGQRSGV